jgi:hypothetical protein
VPYVNRLDAHWSKYTVNQNAIGRQRITCAPFVVALIVEKATVKLVGTTLGDSVDYAAGRTAILG